MPRRVVSGTRLPAVLVHDADDIAWIGAVNAAAAAQTTSAQPRALVPLNTEQALELALLGIVMARPLSLDRVSDLVRRIMAPPVQPTLDVVEGRLQDLARRGLVVITAREPGRALIRRSAAGVRHARVLLRMPGPPPGAAHRDLVFMLKVCMLDVLAAADRPEAIDELRRDLQSALDSAEQAARHCRSTSVYAHQWLERQASRLRDDLRWLTGLTAAAGG
jgi:hypothetical protein